MVQDHLVQLRRAFARSVLTTAKVSDRQLENSFAHVPREHYLGSGPWQVVGALGYESTPDADPAHLYADVLVGILPERHLNNGMPSYHALLMANAAVQAGEHVVHIGAGVGYYTAILAELVGPEGRVSAIEYDADLARRAAENLGALPNVAVVQGDGFTTRFDPADLIYVNAGTTGPAATWLDSLKDGGRLILPLTARRFTNAGARTWLSGHGAVFRITRNGQTFEAKWLSGVGIFPCEGGRDGEAERAIDAALRRGGFKDVKRLYRTGELPEKQCWLRLPTWSLAYR